MGLFDKMREPVILKEDSRANLQLEQLKNIEASLNEEGKRIIKLDIKNLEYGILGENSILFELKNSHLPIYILRDIYLEHGDLSAQIDFLIFTSKLCIVVECKNLYGNIEVNNRGEFIRSVEYCGKWKKEGIYSPITQNQRHLELLKKRVLDNKKNKFSKLIFDKYFCDNFKSIIVLANPKSIINMKYAKKEIKDQIIKVDQLVEYIKNMHNSSKNSKLSLDKHLEWAKSYLNLDSELPTNLYCQKYDQYKTNDITSLNNNIPAEDTNLYKKLKEFRSNKSKEEKIKPYLIYNDNQLQNLISSMPSTLQELLQISGFGNIKVEKYGSEILDIIKKYKNL